MLSLFGKMSPRIYTQEEIAKISQSALLVGDTLAEMAKMIAPGVKTIELDRRAEEFIRAHGASPACKGYEGFPATLCISVNEVVVHGFPSERELKEGDIVSVDCDGCIDALLPIWLENGVNTMFPIEVGTWNASIAPWREKYGKDLRGVGGMNKTVFARDYQAVDQEVERLRPLMELGGYIPCPDHRIAPDAKFENVQYYCEKMKSLTL